MIFKPIYTLYFMINAQLSGEKITSNSTEAYSLYQRSRFGEKKTGKIEYMYVEALFLLEKGKLSVSQGKNSLSFDSLFSKLRKKDKKIETKYPAFKDLRKKGYVLKTALKFGAEFRIYSPGSKPGKEHAPWLLFTTKETEKINWHEFSAKNRIAHSTKKKLLLAIVDEEDSVTYYIVSWFKP
jgi:tRNA-intron endonuclease, archaea type